MAGASGDDPGHVARRLVDTIRYLTLATADGAGRPWISPVWYAPAAEASFLWVSSPEARHSRNIAVRPEVAIVVFDSTVPVGAAEALYVEAVAEPLLGDDARQFVAAYSERSTASGAPGWEVADVLAPARLRLFRAMATSLSVLGEGDRRIPVELSELGRSRPGD